MEKQRIDDGEPAFPGPDQGETKVNIHEGMTLRDYFAAKAMAALVMSGDEGAGDRLDDIPKYAYQIADAMLKARSA